MSLKRLHSDDKIIGILDAISSKTGETYENVTTTQMATLIRNIQLGAKDVWIGTQFAYNQFTSYDVETCYIILESGTVKRCYAGSVIIYDEPITWDSILTNEIITSGRTVNPTDLLGNQINIQLNTSSASTALGWEFYLKESFPNDIYNMSIMQCCDGLVFMPRWERSVSRWTATAPRSGVPGIPYTNMPEIPSDADPIPCRIHATKNANDAIYWYWINDDDSETFVGSNVPIGVDDRASQITFYSIGGYQGQYTIEDFRFRWLT